MKSIMFEMREFSKSIHDYMRTKQKPIDKKYLPPVQAWVLEYLNKQSGEAIYQKDIEKGLNIARSTATKMLSSMEAKGFIERKAEISDGRMKRLELTDKSKNFLEKLKKEMEDIEDELIMGITEGQLEVFFGIVEQMKSNITGKDEK